MVELDKVTEEQVVAKYTELSELTQKLDKEKTELSNALIQLDEQYGELEKKLRDKDKTIADLIISKRRLEDLLKLAGKELSELKDGYKLPIDEPSFSLGGWLKGRTKE